MVHQVIYSVNAFLNSKVKLMVDSAQLLSNISGSYEVRSAFNANTEGVQRVCPVKGILSVFQMPASQVPAISMMDRRHDLGSTLMGAEQACSWRHSQQISEAGITDRTGILLLQQRAGKTNSVYYWSMPNKCDLKHPHCQSLKEPFLVRHACKA